jgi:hypothetical protein
LLAGIRGFLNSRAERHEARDFDVADSLGAVEALGPLAALAQQHSGNRFVKWAHYFDVYDEQFQRLIQMRDKLGVTAPIRVLELGVWRGGSLELWRKYFGENAIVFGIELNPDYPRVHDSVGKVRFGSQADPAFLSGVVDEMGGVDIVIDDGSHVSAHVVASLSCLFQRLSSPGLYIVEDLHTSYWREWGGGYLRKGTSVEALKKLVDTLHSPYHRGVPRNRETGLTHENLGALHFYDSIAVLEKGQVESPRPFQAGILD